MYRGYMPKVKLRNDRERFDQLLRRFKKSVDNDGLLQEIREREAFEKPTTKRKRAKAAAKKRWAKKLREMQPAPRSNQR